MSPPIVCDMATGTVRVSTPESSSANRNSFQVRIRPNTAVAASPAITCGRQILKKTRTSDDPSMRAASSTSGDNSSKKLFIIQIAKRQIERRVESNDADIGAGEAGDPEHDEDRDDDDDRRQHARRQDHEKIGVVALQRIAREAEGGERADRSASSTLTPEMNSELKK